MRRGNGYKGKMSTPVQEKYRRASQQCPGTESNPRRAGSRSLSGKKRLLIACRAEDQVGLLLRMIRESAVRVESQKYVLNRTDLFSEVARYASPGSCTEFALLPLPTALDQFKDRRGHDSKPQRNEPDSVAGAKQAVPLHALPAKGQPDR
jgi:hypothetical protein